MSFCASRFRSNFEYKRQNETHTVFFKLSNRNIRRRSGQCCDHISSIEPEKNDVINHIHWKLHPLGLHTFGSWVKIGGYRVEWESCKHDLSIFGQMHLAVNFLVQANFAFYCRPAVVKGRAEKLQLLFLHLLPPLLVGVKNLAGLINLAHLAHKRTWGVQFSGVSSNLKRYPTAQWYRC